MHKTRQFLPPISTLTPGSYDLYSPRLRVAAFPRASLNVTGDFEASVRPILEATIRNAGKTLDVPQDHVIVPIHELQVPHILDKFKEATVYPEEFSVPARAQQSIRYLPASRGLYVSPLIGASAQVSDTSRYLAGDAPQARGRYQADGCRSHDFTRERVLGSALLRAGRPGATLRSIDTHRRAGAGERQPRRSGQRNSKTLRCDCAR